MIALQLLFACIPFSVGLQIYSVNRLHGPYRPFAWASAGLMGLLWLVVIVTGIAGSDRTPYWLVFMSPLFVIYLSVLLMTERGVFRRTSTESSMTSQQVRLLASYSAAARPKPPATSE